MKLTAIAIALAAASLSFNSFAQKVKTSTVGPLIVVDSSGKVIGRFVGDGGPMFVVPMISNSAASISIVTSNEDVTSLLAALGGWVWFESTSCTGQAYIQPSSTVPGLLPSSIIAVNGHVIAYVAAGGTRADYNVGAWFDGVNCNVAPGLRSAFPASAINLTTAYPYPWKVQ